MLTSHPLNYSAEAVYSVLENGGTVILPSKLGYAFLGVTPKAVEHIYTAKERPKQKPSGVLANHRVFSQVTNSIFKRGAAKLEYPVGLIEEPIHSHPSIASLPFITKQNGRVAFFLNMDPFFDQLTNLAFDKNQLITVTSANKAGSGNSLRSEDLHEDIIRTADLVVLGDDLTWVEDRNSMDQITASLIDLRERKLLRKGVFSARTLAQAIEQGMVLRTQVESKPKKGNQFQTCIYLRAFEESTYDKMQQAHNVDWFFLDLEDGCPADKKEHARALIQEHCNRGSFENINVGIRLNGLGSDELQQDLKMVLNSSVKGFALPMLRGAEDVKTYEKAIVEMELRNDMLAGHFKLFPIIETSDAFLNAQKVAKSSNRNVAMFLGHADLFAELNMTRNQENLQIVRLLYLNAARAGGISAFDTPWENVKDLPGLEEDARQAQQIGLDGKVALTFEQIDVIDRIFGLKASDKETYSRLLGKYDGGCQIIDGVFVAPPLVKKFEKELSKRMHESLVVGTESKQGCTFDYGLELEKAHPGQVIESPYEMTLDEAFIAQWQAMVPTGNPLETSSHFCEKVGLDGRLIPFHALVNIGLCLMVESFSESSLFHLGISNVVYERAAHAGDTVRTLMIIDRIDPKSNGKMSVVETRVIIVNQRNERVVSMNRNSMFPYIDPDSLSHQSSEPDHELKHLFEQEPSFKHRQKMFWGMRHIPRRTLGWQPRLDKDQLILHGMGRAIGLSTSLNQSTLYKNTHPVHINPARYGMEGLVVCGGFVIPIIHGLASRDIRFAIDQEICDTMHINRIHHEDHLGAMSYVLDVQKLDNGTECLTIRTFGLKNIDAERELRGLDIPIDLLRSSRLKPREIELLCKAYRPELVNRICAIMTWKMWRKV